MSACHPTKRQTRDGLAAKNLRPNHAYVPLHPTRFTLASLHRNPPGCLGPTRLYLQHSQAPRVLLATFLPDSAETATIDVLLHPGAEGKLCVKGPGTVSLMGTELEEELVDQKETHAEVQEAELVFEVLNMESESGKGNRQNGKLKGDQAAAEDVSSESGQEEASKKDGKSKEKKGENLAAPTFKDTTVGQGRHVLSGLTVLCRLMITALPRTQKEVPRIIRSLADGPPLVIQASRCHTKGNELQNIPPMLVKGIKGMKVGGMRSCVTTAGAVGLKDDERKYFSDEENWKERKVRLEVKVVAVRGPATIPQSRRS